MEFILLVAFLAAFACVVLILSMDERIKQAKKVSEQAHEGLIGKFGEGDYFINSGVKNCIGINWNKSALILGKTPDTACAIPFDMIVASEMEIDGALVTTTKSVSKTNRGSQLAGGAIGAAVAGPAGLLVGGLSGSTRTSGRSIEKQSVNLVKLIITLSDRIEPIRECVLYENHAINLGSDNPTMKEVINKARHYDALLSQIIEARNSTPQVDHA